MHHETILEGLENAAPSGFTLDAKGNFKAHMNIALLVIVETSPGNWEDSRRVYMTLSLKGKTFIMDA